LTGSNRDSERFCLITSPIPGTYETCQNTAAGGEGEGASIGNDADNPNSHGQDKRQYGQDQHGCPDGFHCFNSLFENYLRTIGKAGTESKPKGKAVEFRALVSLWH